MSSEQTHVIVGAGMAGAKAAETLRAEGFDGRIVLIGAEQERPYDRPPLSKGYLLGDQDRNSVFLHPLEWYGDNHVELLTGRRVARLDRAAHEVELAGGERIGYTKALLATGSSPRRLKIDGSNLDGVHYLRRFSQSDALREAFATGGRVVVVGAGWIGLETAAAARKAGCEVTVVEPMATPLHGALGPEMGTFFGDVHRRQGVDLRLGVGVTGFTGAGKVSAVATDAGEIPADIVVVGIGARPNVELAEDAGLTVDNGGVLVDAALRTEDPDVFAAGDIASVPNSRYGPPYSRRALAERRGFRPVRREGDARSGRHLRPAPVFLHRPVRPRHGIRRLVPARRIRPGRHPWRRRRPGLLRVLAGR
ncbi:NAD(P)/FAD-dependent oxidoreductase [Kutzneria kofuensis]|uniref:NAD(P)/FAD-dependent oxidoreductase n=1 Tax=Kutzneria kofuensis TaxID=103725 RepID=UPI0031E6761D